MNRPKSPQLRINWQSIFFVALPATHQTNLISTQPDRDGIPNVGTFSAGS
jgi:hypothetical protein